MRRADLLGGVAAALLVAGGAMAADDRALCAGSLDHARSIAACTSWLAGHPNDWEVYYWRGIEYAETGRHDLAIADYTRALALDAANVASLKSRAFSYGATGRRDEAAADLRRAVSLAPDDPNIHSALRRLGIAP